MDFTNKVQNNAFDIPTMYYTGSPTPAYLCIQLWVSGIKQKVVKPVCSKKSFGSKIVIT